MKADCLDYRLYNKNIISTESSNYTKVSYDTEARVNAVARNEIPSSLLTLTAATGEEIRFSYQEDLKKVTAYVDTKDKETLRLVKQEDMPLKLQAIKSTSALASFLINAYVKVSKLNNEQGKEDIKLYIEQRGLGGGKEDRSMPSWNKLLSDIKHLQELRHSSNLSSTAVKQSTPLKAFISYAWEDTSTLDGKIENSKLQRFLENLRDDLQEAGISVFLDIGDMHGNMKLRMEENLHDSSVIIPVVTPRFLSRAKAVPQTNLGFEYELTLQKAKDIPYGICPIHYKGSFEEAFGKWGDTNELKELKGYLIRDCTNLDNYSEILVGTQRPLGIIPAIYNIDCNDDKKYSSLVQMWRYEKMTLLPPANPDFTGREELLTKLAESFAKGEKSKVINQKQAVSGLGGVGKSELALEYSHKYKDKYIIKRWINSEGASLKPDFEKMASELALDSKGMTDFELASEVYKKLSVIPNWLLIFDNAEDFESIKDFLPAQTTKDQHILITSRSNQWKHSIAVDTFTDAEAQEFIIKELGDSANSSASKARELAEAVGHLPLALSHAVAYIKQSGISLKAYIDTYNEKGIDLLQTEDIEGSSAKYPKSVLTTWLISMEKIKQQSPVAAKILTACAYLGPDNIPLELFAKEELMKEATKVHEALKVLRKYSLIDSAKMEDHIQIHRLVQAVIKLEHKQNATPQEIEQKLASMASALKSCCPWNKITNDDFNKARLLLPHIKELVTNLEPYSTVINDQENKGAVAQSDLLHTAAKTCHDLGNYQEARDLYQKALVINEKHYGKDHPDVASTLQNLGIALRSLGDYQEAKDLYQKVLAINEKHYDKDHSVVASTLENLGNALRSLGDYRGAKDLYLKVLVIKEKHYDKDHPNVAITLQNLGSALLSLGDYQEAKDLYLKVLVIKEKHYGKDHPDVARTLQNLGNALKSLGDYREARDLYQKALVINEKHYGKDHPVVARTLENLGNVLLSLGDYQEAKDLYQKVLVINEKHYGKDHPNVAMTLENLGNVLLSLGDYREAKDLYQKALVINEKHYGRDHPDVAMTLENLGNVLLSLGDYREAKDLYQKTLVIKEKHYGKDHPNVAMTLENLGTALKSLGDYREARDLYQKALVINEKHYGKDHPDVAITLFNLSITNEALSNNEQALVEARLAHKIMTNSDGFENHPHTISFAAMVKKLESKQESHSSTRTDNKILAEKLKLGDKTTKENKCTVCRIDKMKYDNPLLNHPKLLKSILAKTSLDKVLNFGSRLSENLITEAAENNDTELLLAGLDSLDYA